MDHEEPPETVSDESDGSPSNPEGHDDNDGLQDLPMNGWEDFDEDTDH